MAVKGKFPDYSKPNHEGSFSLTCDKTMFPGHWIPPIQWSGYVNNTEVSFLQISHSGYHIEDYDFSNFPENLKSAIPYIVDAINKAMKTMD